jgi:hypothetical protein
MALVDPSCFKALSNADQVEQIYEALFGISSGTGGLSEVDTGNSLWVDEEFGDDLTALRARFDLPFSTVEAARDAAQSGDTVFVRPGDYATTSSLAVHQVNWHFDDATVTWTGMNTDSAIWDDKTGAMSFIVSGTGTFIGIAAAAQGADCHAIRIANGSSVVTIKGRRASTTDTEGCISHFNGTLIYDFDTVENLGAAGAGGYGIWWINGESYGRVGTVDGYTAPVYFSDTQDGGNNFYLEAYEIKEGTFGSIVNFGIGANTPAWIRCFICHGIDMSGTGKLYVEFQKNFGQIKFKSSDNGNDRLLYVKGFKSAKIANNTMIDCTGTDNVGSYEFGYARIEIQHYDDQGFGGRFIDLTQGFEGTVEIIGGKYVSTATADGIWATDGRLRLSYFFTDTSINNATNPITLTEDTNFNGPDVYLQMGTVLVAEATRDSIECGAVHDVHAYGAWANKAVDGNITIKPAGGLTVSSDVT